ncbi:hypothetical protein ACQFX9_14400 [Aliinostoc sp. HNIBRCY26]|uniref:hypothetical protein n=1 Tax=Aliinostoc sp. HNIBRCY26 TaxID=3418997 RepID=UPI003CFEC665
MRLSKSSLLVILALGAILIGTGYTSLISPASAQKKRTIHCNYPFEEPSNVQRTLRLNKFGIIINIPANYRAMAAVDGSIHFTDNGTYQLLNCLKNNPGATGGREYNAIIVDKSKANYLYSNVYDKVPGKENMFIVWEKTEHDNYTSHKISLRIKTNKGIMEVSLSESYPVMHEQDVKNEIRSIIQIAQGIQII